MAEYNKFVRQLDGNTATVNASTTPEKKCFNSLNVLLNNRVNDVKREVK